MRIPARPLCVSLTLLLAACAITPAGQEQQGRTAAAEVEARMGLMEPGELLRYVQTVGARLAARAPRTDVTYSFQVVHMAEPNAFALPGGRVYVSRGLLALLNSEDELAGVLAHEIAHVSARHHAKAAMRRVPLLPVGLAAGLGGMAVGMVSPALGQAVSAVAAAPAALALASYSRGQEDQADALGQEFMAAAGWDPAALGLVMESLARDETLRGGDPDRQSYFASHPASPQRARAARERAATLSAAQRRAIHSERRAFFAQLDGLLVGPSAAEGVFDEETFLHPDLDFALRFPQAWKTRNTRTAILGIREDGAVGVVVGIAAEGDDPEAGAQRARGSGLRLESSERLEVAGYPALRARARSGGNELLLHWIAYRGQVFQVAGIAPRSEFEAERAALQTVATSFRPLRPADRARIREARLRVVDVRASETLADVLERHPSPWSVEEAAAMNAVAADAPLDAGALKLARSERYTPQVGSGP